MKLPKFMTTPIPELFKRTTKPIYYAISLSDGSIIGVVKRRRKDEHTFKRILSLVIAWESRYGNPSYCLFDKPSKLPIVVPLTQLSPPTVACCKYSTLKGDWNTLYINPTYLY